MRYFLIALVLLSFSSCYQVERNCTDYKTGSFYSEVIIDSVVYKSDFTRTKDLQIEVYQGKTDSAQVRWINDCEMIFKTINPKNMAERKDVHLKILTTTDSSYTFEYSYVGEKLKQKGKAFKK
ncbi:DNA topoisomerase IV [Lacinutrix sp. WUR7]|uniref:DNA topoisomerase IV n=1 Tax=Lacinutrix sp. WUR7 TaxID=2653681 RepID=UPI00193E61EB|nr:DNA topoisomerase IV [Lacinutrix sp. WUR7]QRM90150.1 DNA topoisomerase IV [Lacinutrix sp. WUR7]